MEADRSADPGKADPLLHGVHLGSGDPEDPRNLGHRQELLERARRDGHVYRPRPERDARTPSSVRRWTASPLSLLHRAIARTHSAQKRNVITLPA
jgi:hypothetical protein